MFVMAAVVSRASPVDRGLCDQYAGPRDYASGVASNGSCVACRVYGRLVSCDQQTPAMLGILPTTITYHGDQNRAGCTGSWCVACNGTIITPPSNATIYISPSCGFFDDASTLNPPTVTIVGIPKWVTLVVGRAGAHLSEPLETVGSVAVTGNGNLTIPTANKSDCALRVMNVGSQHGEEIVVLTSAPIVVEGPGECGVAIEGKILSHKVSATVELASISSATERFFAVVAGNVRGSLTTNETCAALILEVDPLIRFDVPANVRSVNLSNYLNVFGHAYEVAYFHDGATTVALPPLEAFIDTHLKQILMYTLVVWVALLRVTLLKPKHLKEKSA